MSEQFINDVMSQLEQERIGELLGKSIPTLSEYMTIEFLKISNDLTKQHKYNYTEERVMATFMWLVDIYEGICQARINNSSPISSS